MPPKKNPLEVSDEEFLDMAIPDDEELEGSSSEEEEVDNSEEEVDTTTNETTEDAESTVEESEEADSEEEDESTENQDDADTDVYDKSESDNEDETLDDSITDNEDTDTQDDEPDTSIDYKAEYQKLLSPFKANGKDMSIANVDDARTLMMMGANYNKKMHGLKPHLKIVKTLENNDLLDPEKINYLIDLSKKNPEAIQKLLKDSNLDPMDIDTEEESTYKPSNHSVSDAEIALDQVLDDIKSSPKFQDTIEVISNQWDDASKRIISENPELIKIINGHMESGIYDQIASVVNSEKVLGRLNGLSDIEAYKQIGDAIHEQGGFQQTPSQEQKPDVKDGQYTPKKPKQDAKKLASKKRAASSTKSTVSNKSSQDFNPLSMSDEEFEKLGVDKFL